MMMMMMMTVYNASNFRSQVQCLKLLPTCLSRYHLHTQSHRFWYHQDVWKQNGGIKIKPL